MGEEASVGGSCADESDGAGDEGGEAAADADGPPSPPPSPAMEASGIVVGAGGVLHGEPPGTTGEAPSGKRPLGKLRRRASARRGGNALACDAALGTMPAPGRGNEDW